MKTHRFQTTIGFLLCFVCIVATAAWMVACSSGSSGPTSPETPVAGGGSGSGGSGGSGSGGSGSGDGGGSDGSDGSGQSGTLTIRMRDDAIDNICELWVHFVELKVKPDGQPVTYLGPIGETLDLLLLQNGNDVVLGEFGVTPGKYQYIEMLLDQDLSYVIEKDEDTGECLFDEQVPLQIPSEKFKIKGPPFDVGADTVAKIHFDAPKSLKEKGGNGNGNGNGNSKGWMLKADVSLEDVVVVETAK
ncbi:MAG: DUF4382 domain-containing protein [Acidobacteriota bacterium]